MQLDGSTGAVRIRTTWNDLPPLAQAIALGVNLHEGRFFGRANQIINTLVAAVIVWPVCHWIHRLVQASTGRSHCATAQARAALSARRHRNCRVSMRSHAAAGLVCIRDYHHRSHRWSIFTSVRLTFLRGP